MEKRAIVIATDLGASGEAVFRYENRLGFVAGLLPGESGDVQFEVKGGVWRGKLLHRLSDAPERIPHPCPHAGNCPGSRFGCITREAELTTKRQHAETTLQKIGGIEHEVESIVTAGTEWGYRNKLEMSINNRGGTTVVGYHLPNDPKRIVPIKDCFLGEDVLRQLLQTIIGQAKSSWKSILQKSTRLTLRSGDGLHVHISTNSTLTPTDCNNLQGFFREYIGLIGITAAQSQENESNATEPMVKTIVGELLLPGHDGVPTHPLTFRQVNDSVARLLTSAVEEWCSGVVGTVFDLYGGYGPFARRIASIYGNDVYVLEMSATAIRDGQRALKKKPLSLTYYKCDVVKGFPTIATDIKPEAILLDPPYRGAGEPVVKEILNRKPHKIGYIACHGAVLARDLKLLLAGGYQLKRLRLFDMFPRTPDVEWFTELERSR